MIFQMEQHLKKFKMKNKDINKYAKKKHSYLLQISLNKILIKFNILVIFNRIFQNKLKCCKL